MYDLLDGDVSVYGDVAVVAGRFRNVQVATDGSKIEKNGRSVRVYVRREGRWINILHQATAICA